MSDTIEFRSRRKVAAVPPSLHVGEPAQSGSMPLWWRDEAARLERLGYRWPHTAASDYGLVRALSIGAKIARYAATTDISIGELTARWQKLTGPLRDQYGNLPIEAQSRLLQVLRHRAGTANPGEAV